MNPKSISMLGCGWLGFPLAQKLLSLGYSIKGSTTSHEKIEKLKSVKIQPYLLSWTPYLQGENVDSFFDSKVLFLTVPFRRRMKDPGDYLKQISSIISYVEKSPIDFVLFSSSTSVYPSTLKDSYEEASFKPETERAKVLLDVEKTLLSNARFSSTILRFAGLYGGQRKIGRFLSGQKDVKGAKSPVNLIHLDDCIKILIQIIEEGIRGEVFNACSDQHPIKKDIYAKAAILSGFEPPQFLDEETNVVKIVNNKKLKKRLNYQFLHPDPLNDL